MPFFDVLPIPTPKPINPRMFWLWTTEGPSIVVPFGMGNGNAKISGGIGGWQEVALAKRTAMTNWPGVSPYHLSVPVLLEGHYADISVEPSIWQLQVMGNRNDALGRPPVLAFAAPIWGTNLRWVIESIEWGDEIRRGSDGARTRAWLTINLLEYVAPVYTAFYGLTGPANDAQARHDAESAAAAAAESKAAAQAANDAAAADASGDGGGQTAAEFIRPFLPQIFGGTGAGGGRSTGLGNVAPRYTVKAGDTLADIAAAKLGGAENWHTIADLNGIRDPRSIRVGQVLIMPAWANMSGQLATGGGGGGGGGGSGGGW